MWDFFATVRSRHSIRQFQSDMPVEQEKLHAILETACAAPSAGDLQAYKIFLVNSEDKRQQLQACTHQQDFVAQAPVSLVFCADSACSAEKFGERGAQLYALQDATIAAAYAQLAAVAAGLASTWVGYFDEDKIRSLLKLGEGMAPIAILSLGYAAESAQPTSRRPIQDIVQTL